MIGYDESVMLLIHIQYLGLFLEFCFNRRSYKFEITIISKSNINWAKLRLDYIDA